MAGASPRRPNATAEETAEEGYTVVESRAAKRRLRREDIARQDLDQDRSGPLPEWRLTAAGAAFTSRYQTIRWMEEDQHLRFRVTVTPGGNFVIRAGSWEAARALEDFEQRKPGGVEIQRKEPEVRGVLLGYPAHLPLDPIAEHPAVAKAERCLYNAGRGRRLPTRSVRVTLRGQLPPSLDLGCWGRFACRRFVPEPIRCFRCQAFGHHQRECRRPKDLCGRCSGEHETRECLLRLREGGGAPAPLCPNCGAGHYAWHRRCPARLRRIPGAALPRGDSGQRPRRPPAPAATRTATSDVPAPENGGRRRQRRRRRRGRGGATGERLQPPPAPSTGEGGGPLQPMVHSERVAVAASPVTPSNLQAETRRPRAAAVDTSAKTETELQGSSQSSQTGRCYVFSEADLVDLLTQHEHLLVQEREALRSRISHEPALHCTRRHVREGLRLPYKLPMARPLENSPRFRHHVGEEEWVELTEEDPEEEAVEDSSSDENRDISVAEAEEEVNVEESSSDENRDISVAEAEEGANEENLLRVVYINGQQRTQAGPFIAKHVKNCKVEKSQCVLCKEYRKGV